MIALWEMGYLARVIGTDPETLAGLAAKGLDIYAYCNRCNHSAVAPLAILLVKLGPSWAVPAVGSRLVCRSCGSKDISTRPHWPDSIGLATWYGSIR